MTNASESLTSSFIPGHGETPFFEVPLTSTNQTDTSYKLHERIPVRIPLAASSANALFALDYMSEGVGFTDGMLIFNLGASVMNLALASALDRIL